MKKLNFDTYKYQLPIYLWAIFILVVCILPVNVNTDSIFKDLPVDKPVHFLLFLVLAFLMMRGVRSKTAGTWQMIVQVITNGAIYGLFTELLQHFFIAGRTGDVWDLVADILGCTAGAWWFTRTGGFKLQ